MAGHPVHAADVLPHPAAPGEFERGGGRAWVPIDDNTTTVFSFGYRVNEPFDQAELDSYYRSGALFPPRIERGTFTCLDGTIIDHFLPVANKENDYLLDRQMQRTQNFSGIWGVHDQDRALAENSKALPGDPGSSTGPGNTWSAPTGPWSRPDGSC